MDAEKMFDINDKEILLYGAASIGNLAFDWFENAGFHVAAYLDKRGNEIDSLRERPVYSIYKDEIEEFKDSSKYVVFISVKNVFEHSNIANALIKIGFHNIIYRPIDVINGGGTEEQNRLYEVYDIISNGKLNSSIKDIPMTCEIEIHKPISDYVLSRDADSIVTLISIDSLHTDSKVSKTPWFNKTILSLLPHIDFFNYLNGKKDASYDRYMEYCILESSKEINITESWKRNVIKNRANVYEHMKQSLELESDFFVRNAPNAKWNQDKGIFNLQSGKHRAAFWASLGRYYIPLRLRISDYESYLNINVANQLFKLLADKGITQLSAPIGHPLLFDYPCESKAFYYGLLYKLFYYISDCLYNKTGQLDFEALSIYCELHDYGFIERTIRKSGCGIKLSIPQKDMELMQILDKLLYCDLLSLNEDINSREYDYIIIDVCGKHGCQELENIKQAKEKLIIVNAGSDQEEFLIKNYKTEYFYRGVADGLDVCVIKI